MELAGQESSVVWAMWPTEEAAWSVTAAVERNLADCRRTEQREVTEGRMGRLEEEQVGYWCSYSAENSSASGRCLCRPADSDHTRHSAPGRHWYHTPDRHRQRSSTAVVGHMGLGFAEAAIAAAAEAAAVAAVAAGTDGIGRTATLPPIR